jgi:hypothetical protein
MGLSIFKKASKIHAAKCNKANNFSVAIESFEKLQDIKLRLESATEEELIELKDEIEIWKNNIPIINDRELNL